MQVINDTKIISFYLPHNIIPYYIAGREKKMKKITLILSLSMMLFSTAYSNAWCLCVPVSEKSENTTSCSECCTQPETSSCDTTSTDHCFKYRNILEAVPASTLHYSGVPVQHISVPLMILTISVVKRDKKATAPLSPNTLHSATLVPLRI